MITECHDHCAHHQQHHELVVTNLSVAYRQQTVLQNISFETSCGNRVALIGPNGAGKSSLLKAIAGLLPQRTGSITWRGTSVKKWSREFAYLPQREEVDWAFPITVRGMVEMGRYPQTSWWKPFTKHDHAIVDQALDDLDLIHLQDRQIHELSGGQQQRAFLARAIAQEAHVLLLDEPFTGLDRKASFNLAQRLEILANQGRLIIASHHDLTTATTWFDQALVIATKQIAFGSCKEVLSEQCIQQTFQ